MTEAKQIKIFGEVLSIVDRLGISNIQIAGECLSIIKRELSKNDKKNKPWNKKKKHGKRKY
jgi:hypothetical protein